MALLPLSAVVVPFVSSSYGSMECLDSNPNVVVLVVVVVNASNHAKNDVDAIWFFDDHVVDHLF